MAFIGQRGAPGSTALFREAPSLARSALSHRFSRLLLGAAAARLALYLLGRYRAGRRARQLRQQWTAAGRDVVVLHQFLPGTTVPNTSPFALKLETFLRMAGITYVIDNQQPQNARTNKCPWITINGKDMADSELIIDFLTKHFRPSLLEDLSPADKALGRAVQHLLDDHAVMSVFFKTYSCDNAVNIAHWVHKDYRTNYTAHWKHERKWIDDFFYAVGVGRLSERQAMFFLHRDLQALDDILADKSYILSESPSTTDACVFAQLSQVLYACAPEVEAYVRQSHPRLVKYHHRMKERYWPDWHRCLAPQ